VHCGKIRRQAIQCSARAAPEICPGAGLDAPNEEGKVKSSWWSRNRAKVCT